MLDELIGLLKTVDQYWQVMPSYLETPISDEAKALGWLEDCIGEGTTFKWQRLTQRGKEAREVLCKGE